MANILLRSGNLDDFIALGENGHAVFSSAVQIRETLRLRRQHLLADCLAIPQPDENGEKVDWYSPRSGDVILWAAASLTQREYALRTLEKCRLSIEALSKRCQMSEKSAIKLFGALLENVLRFPGSQHVYLVGGEPVITFWGFNSLTSPGNEDPLDQLRETLIPDPVALQLSESVMTDAPPPRVIKTKPPATKQPHPLSDATSQPEEPVTVAAPVTTEISPVDIPQPVPATSTAPSKKTRRVVLAGVVAAAIPVAGWMWSTWLQPGVNEPGETLAQPTPEVTVPAEVMPAKPVITAALPLLPATVVPPPADKPATETKALKEEPVPKDALVLPAASVKAGTTRFLNGQWRATIAYEDAIGGKPPALRFQINNNTGTVRLTNGDNITCRADVSTGLLPSGNLSIKIRGKARCADGSRYTLPEILCTQGLTGPAQCTGRYANDTVVPVVFRKVSK